MAKGAFEFRLLDRVAVKGKSEGIVIYELLSEQIEGHLRPALVDRYEQAFALFFNTEILRTLCACLKRKVKMPRAVSSPAAAASFWLTRPVGGMGFMFLRRSDRGN